MISDNFVNTLEEANTKLRRILNMTEKEINDDFNLWKERREPFIHYSQHDGKFSSNDTLWDDEI